jgi:ATP-dependent Lon protease
MSGFDADSGLPDNFSGNVRLFPLPNLVVFPHALQPLHIFEDRYRKMMEDSLAGDRLLATALLEPGWEADYEGRPKIFPVVCVGRVVSHTRLEDGRFNLLLLGVARATVVRELPPDESYRQVEVSVLEDSYPAETGHGRRRIHDQLLSEFQRCFREATGSEEPLEQLLHRELPLGVLTDIVAFTMKLDLPLKQRLLSEQNVDARANLLLEWLSSWPADTEMPDESRGFPPRFSDN